MVRTIYLTSHPPFPPSSGGRLRTVALWKALQMVGEVEVWVLGQRPPLRERRTLAEHGVRVWPARIENTARRALRYLIAGLRGESIPATRYLSAKRIRRIRDALDARRPDVVLLGDTYMATLVPHVSSPEGPMIIVDTHNVESLLWQRMANAVRNPLQKMKYWWLAWNSRILEQRLLPLADEVWATSEHDASFYREVIGLPRVAIIPNVLDLACYPVSGEDDVEAGSIVFTGWYRYWPNEDAALRLIAISRRLRAEGIQHRLYLVGRDPTPAMYRAAQGLPQVIITSEVPDVRPYVARAAVYAAPLRAGSGTKFKVLEALAMGRPVVTTSIGAEGLELVPGRDAMVVDDPEAYYEAVRLLLTDPTRGESMGAKGRTLVQERYSLGALTALLRDRLAQL